MPRGIIPGGAATPALRMTDAGVDAYKFVLGAVPKEMRENIRFVHVRRSADLYRIAERWFNNERRRPTSSGDRPGDRMTGRFTFGTGGAFKAVIFELSTGRQGIGFPDIAVADRRTRFVWRVHEFGLPSNHPLGPQGQHILPSRFHWDPAQGEGARLVLGKDPKDRYRRKGKRSTRVRRENTERLGQGVPAKNAGAGFARPAFEEFRRTVLEGEYRKVVNQAFKKLK